MERLSPILMTALVTGVELIPLALSAGEPGREIQQPMAVVILGGIVTSTLLNIIVLPALYLKYGKASTRDFGDESRGTAIAARTRCGTRWSKRKIIPKPVQY
jgi:predicted RND superfamily exporter protein